MEKQCRKCGQIKPASDFSPDMARRDGLGVYCKRCKAEQTRDWVARNREKIAEYRRATADHINAYHRAWNAAHPRTSKRRKPYARRDSDEYRARHRQHQREYQQRYPDRVRNSQRTYYRTHVRVRVRAATRDHIIWTHRSRARRAGATGSFTLQEWRDLCAQFGNVCLCCKRTVPLTVDHVIPFSRGGTNNIDNIQPLCGTCNRRKGTKTTDYRP